MNNNVTVFVSPRTQTFLEYKGILESENDDNVTLKNVSIKLALPSLQRGMFGGGVYAIAENIESVVINKEYIISCYK